jgi:hypothetical protein
VKILFVARHFTYFRNFESVIRELAARGHELHLAADREEQLGGRAMVDRLSAELPNVTVAFTPPRQDARLFELATALRLSADYFRYLDPAYADAPAIRARAWERTPRLALALARAPFRFAAAPLLRTLEQALPVDAAVQQFIAGMRPDIVLLTPLIELGSPQTDYLKAAQALGIPTVLAVWSWDHLTSKSLIRIQPDRVLVWNDTQRDEAVSLHGIPADRIIVTGAQCFDQWFDRQPSRARAEFCRDAGLPADRPIVLYVCSSLFRGSPSEAAFVRTWLQALRQSPDAVLRDAAVLVRPHPQRLAEWEGVTLDGLGPVSVWGGNPVDARSRSDYFDSLHYAAAVVGLNNSALIEAAVIDRPVHTLLLPEFRANQHGTLHFKYLAEGPYAFLRTAHGLGEHFGQLAAALEGESDARNRRFVQHFVRPYGAATPVFADAVEQIAAGRPARRPAGRGAALLRPVVSGLYAAAGTAWGARLLEDPVAARERAGRDVRLAGKRALIDDQRRLREQKEEDKRRRWRHKRRLDHLVRLKTVAKRMIGQH